MIHAITYFSFISASIYGCFQDLVCLQKSRDGQSSSKYDLMMIPETVMGHKDGGKIP